MRTLTKAEAERDLAAVMNAVEKEPVRIREGSKDVVVISAAEFEETRELLRKERGRSLEAVMKRASDEARANGFTEDMLPDLLKD